MWKVEHTDTFAGEANYCWCNRYTIDGDPSRLALVRKAKQLAGLTGVRCKVTFFSDELWIQPAGLAQIVYVIWQE